MTPAISIDAISKSFGKYPIISSLSMQVETGRIYGLVGLNGAGKTTLLRLMLGILKPDSGTISINGHTPWNHDPRYYRQSGVVMENDGFWGNLTARENCAIYAAAKGIDTRTLDEYLTTYWNGSELFANSKTVRHFSRGQRMQCALCRAFIGNPAVCFFDEPALALDLNAYNHFKQMVIDARNRGATLIISSHQLDTIDELCDRVGILRDGAITEISRSRGSENWYINTAGDRACSDLITRGGGSAVRFERGWHFTIEQADRGIPEIIRALVGAGFSINEVRREESGFGSAIRSLYTGSSRPEGRQ